MKSVHLSTYTMFTRGTNLINHGQRKRGKYSLKNRIQNSRVRMAKPVMPEQKLMWFDRHKGRGLEMVQ